MTETPAPIKGIDVHRRQLLELLSGYQPIDADERESLRRIQAFVRDHADCFERSLRIGHITGSAWLLNADGSRVLLTRHRKLGRWLQLGGHADGDPDVMAVALCEAEEESGLSDIVPLSSDIFDVDVHQIPVHGDVPAHDHYDVRFLLQYRGDRAFRVSAESDDLAWVSAGELESLETDASVRRMARKWRALSPILMSGRSAVD